MKCSCIMDSSTSVFYAAAGLPALVSTGITFLYFFLKACSYVFNAISHQTKGRVATAMPGSGQQEYCADTGEEGHTEICKQIQGNLSEQYGRRPEQSPGTILLPRRGQNICLPSIGDDTRHTEEPAFRENAKRLQSRRHQTPKKYYGKGPENSCVNATGIFTKCGSRDNASDEQSQCAEGNGRKGNRE